MSSKKYITIVSKNIMTMKKCLSLKSNICIENFRYVKFTYNVASIHHWCRGYTYITEFSRNLVREIPGKIDIVFGKFSFPHSGRNKL